MMRFPSREIKIGNCPMGGNNPIRVQSMTNTPALDIDATLIQTKKIFDAGADYVRISTPSSQSAENLHEIRKKLNTDGYSNPLIADIHFNPSIALIAARLVEKVRINPGNYTGFSPKGKTYWSQLEQQEEFEKIRESIKPLVKVCKEYGTAIRVGTNFGSLSPRIVSQYGNTPEGMVESTIEFLQILENLGFDQTVISLKASSPLITVQSYWLMVQKMLEKGMAYPLHLGVTEAGEGEDGRINSALGIGALLNAGIGDTVRVSLSEAPEAEIPVTLELVTPFNEALSRKIISEQKYSIDHFELQKENLPELQGNHKAIVVQVDGNLTEKPNYRAKFLEGGPESSTPDILVEPNCTQKPTEDITVLFEKDLFENKSGPSNGFSVVSLSLPFSEEIIEKLQNHPSLIVLLRNQPSFYLVEDFWTALKKRKIKAALIPLVNKDEIKGKSFTNFVATRYGALLLQRKINGLGVYNPDHIDCSSEIKKIYRLLQASGTRITNTQFISCPTCARTSFEMVKVVKQVKQLTSGFPGLKIAVMGCIVNGPGEMADADYGILGVGRNRVTIYKGKEPVIKNIDQNEAAAALFNLINLS